MDALTPAEPAIRLAAFVGIFATMAAWEALAPRRSRRFGRLSRWPGNLGVVVLGAIVVRLVLPTAAVGVAFAAEQHGWGVLNWIEPPRWVQVVIAVVLLDLAIYGQHALFHAAPILWRLHRMHHADLDFDVTTGVRFHPLEILLSMLIKLALVAALGAPALAVLIFELALNATAMFNHANVAMPRRWDALLRRLVVTPDMHRVHHSAIDRETNSNFGFNLPWWDRLFGTYRAAPEAGHEGMVIGLNAFRDARELRLHRMLLQPFRAEASPSEEILRDSAPAGSERR